MQVEAVARDGFVDERGDTRARHAPSRAGSLPPATIAFRGLGQDVAWPALPPSYRHDLLWGTETVAVATEALPDASRDVHVTL